MQFIDLILQYIAFRVQNNQIFVSNRWAARNMAYQDITQDSQKIHELATMNGEVINQQ